MSLPTAQDLTAQLLREGRLVELQANSGSVGRPARRFRFRAEAGHVIGVDIGAHRCWCTPWTCSVAPSPRNGSPSPPP
ncbi:hypothetical protein [Streptomyces yanii]|uniref:hypothetical protein n=1 Tax=Streptomyces yanii TaxID=78510 RepID=UPI0031EF19ED